MCDRRRESHREGVCRYRINKRLFRMQLVEVTSAHLTSPFVSTVVLIAGTFVCTRGWRCAVCVLHSCDADIDQVYICVCVFVCVYVFVHVCVGVGD